MSFFGSISGCVFVIIALSLSFTDILAQSLSFKHYAQEDGLPSSTSYAAFQDRHGFMWFATDKGVARYDGYDFNTYTTSDGVADNEVFNFFEDTKGRIWFLSRNGKVSYFHDGVIINSSIDTTLRKLDSDSYISSITEDSTGTIWISALRDGIKCFSAKGEITHLEFEGGPFKYFHAVFFLHSNRILLLTESGVHEAQLDVRKQRLNHIEPYFLFMYPDKFYVKALRLNKNEILFSIYHDVFKVQTERKIVTRLAVEGDQIVYNLTKNQEQVWVCTSKGALMYPETAEEFQIRVLKNYYINSVTQDSEGNYWFTTHGNGVFFCTKSFMLAYTTEDNLVSDDVTCLARDESNRIWFGYGDKEAVSYLDRSSVKSITISHSATATGKVFNIKFSKNRTWVITSTGVLLLEKQRSGVFPWNSRDLIYTNERQIWLGGDMGVTSHSKSFIDSYLMPMGLTDRQKSEWWRTVDNKKFGLMKLQSTYRTVNKLFMDNQSVLWVATANHLYKVVKDSLVLADIIISGSPVAVADFAELADSTLVMATKNNGIVLKKDNNIVVIGTDEGLSGNMCTAVAVDENDGIWVGNEKGINRITGYPDKIHIDHINSLDGLLSDEVTDVLIASDTVWVASRKGLNFFGVDHFTKKRTIPPRMYVHSILVDGKNVLTASRQALLRHDQNNINIEYVGVSYSDAGNILYRYKLDDKDKWQYSRNTSLSFPKLPPGEYKFRIAAKGRADIWSNDVIVVFTIQKPFWKSVWFIVLLVAGMMGVMALTMVIYFRQQRRKLMMEHRITLSELRSLRAQMNPHFLFNALNSIKAIMMKGSMVVAEDYLTRFGKMMRTILDHSDKTTISIAEEVESLKNYLEIEQLRASHPFHYTITIDPAIDEYNTEIPVMIIQPFVENALWHGFGHGKQDDALWLSFKEENNFLVVKIKDNGIGRKRAMELKGRSHKSKGMKLVKERIDIINAGNKAKIELSIHDLADEQGNHPGTSVIIKLPL